VSQPFGQLFSHRSIFYRSSFFYLSGMKAIRTLSLFSNTYIYIFSRSSPTLRCNKHLLAFGRQIKQALRLSGIIGYQFGTVGVSDGISMGTRGMLYSLQSRDLIADQVETAAGGHWLDGMVVVPGCDKNMPGVLMARQSLSNISTPFLGSTVSKNQNLKSWTLESSRFNALRRYHSCRLLPRISTTRYRFRFPVIW